jgi:hypothetical protein
MRELTDGHISLEPRFGINVLALRRPQIHDLRAGKFDIGAGGIKMAVVGDDRAWLHARGGQNTFGGALPWCTGKICLKPVISRTVFSKRCQDVLPA